MYYILWPIYNIGAEGYIVRCKENKSLFFLIYKKNWDWTSRKPTQTEIKSIMGKSSAGQMTDYEINQKFNLNVESFDWVEAEEREEKKPQNCKEARYSMKELIDHVEAKWGEIDRDTWTLVKGFQKTGKDLSEIFGYIESNFDMFE